MIGLLTFLHVAAAILLVLIVLMQGGKGADMGAAFGGSSQTVFGSSGAVTFFTKLTAVVAAVFMLSSVVLAKMSSTNRGHSVIPKNTAQPVPGAKMAPDQNTASHAEPLAAPKEAARPAELPVK